MTASTNFSNFRHIVFVAACFFIASFALTSCYEGDGELVEPFARESYVSSPDGDVIFDDCEKAGNQSFHCP